MADQTTSMSNEDNLEKNAVAKYFIVSGSTRANSQSLKVSYHIKKQLKELNLDNDAYILDLANSGIPEWNEDYWDKGEDWNEVWSHNSKKLKSADAIIIVAPEWNGMVPPSLMNFFHLCSNDELAHKPGLIVSISANASGGSYPVANLRMSSYKNTKICYIPDHVIIKNVTAVLNDSAMSDTDKYIQERLNYSLKVLDIYAKYLGQIRPIKLLYQDSYKYGM
ncbi:MAG: putative [Acyl-carrier-protein] phosphodiesterase [Burkholderiales bacterium]|jgi:NAD(P)H-dependent FMN reductase|nr:putative [Acyl-carrier-protein] phosphodiesterase [Burkholderiales bacterium]